MLGRSTLFLQLVFLFLIGVCFLSFVPAVHAQASAVVIVTVQIIPPEPPVPALDSIAPTYLKDILKTENTSIPGREEAINNFILFDQDNSLLNKMFEANKSGTASYNAASP